MASLKLILIVFLCLCCLSSLVLSDNCPKNCNCQLSPQDGAVFCTPTSQPQLQAQIQGLPNGTVELHIGDHGNLKCNLEHQLTNNTFENSTETLTSLYIEQCDLKSIDASAFQGLTELQELYIMNNSISTLPETVLDSLLELATLTLDNNEITNLPKSLLKKLAEMGVEVDISNNDWNCDCEMYLYRQWMEENNINFTMLCATPENLKGDDVMMLPAEKETFGCREPEVKECCMVFVNITEGDSAAFKCSVISGDPKPTLDITVIRGNPLPESKTEISADNSNITVRDVTVDNNGLFIITASNVWANITTLYFLDVEKVAPTSAPHRDPGSPTGVIIGVVVLVLILSAVIGTLTYWYIKKRRNTDETSSLVTNSAGDRVT